MGYRFHTDAPLIYLRKLLLLLTLLVALTAATPAGGRATPAAPPKWRLQASSVTTTLNDISCGSPRYCLAVGNNATAVKTVDGGLTWTAVTIPYGVAHPSVSYVSVRCPAPGVCSILAAPNVILRTGDGGLVWRRHAISLPATISGLGRLACPTRLICFVTASPAGNPFTWFNHSGAMYKTSDGNKTWQQLPIPPTITCPGDCNARPVGYQLGWVSCQDAKHCRAGGNVFIGSHEGYAATTIRTGNGGATWQIANNGQGPPIGTCPTVSVCTGIYYEPYTPNVGPQLMRSVDAGSTWTYWPTVNPFKPLLTSIACTGSSFCELAGPKGKLAMAIDTKLFVQKTPTSQDLNAVACPRTNACYAVGANGTIVSRQ